MIASPLTCVFYRFAGSSICLVAVFALILTIRYFYHRYRRYQCQLPLLPLSPILIGMLVSLILISFTGIPIVLIQCFTCRPLVTYSSVCKINAFICFAVGTFNMYLLALLSVFRYVSIIHKNSSVCRWLERHRRLSVMICTIISFGWSLPPLLNVANGYTTTGVGFHCSLDWNNSAFHSRLFVYSLLIFNYFLILFVLIYSNLRVYFVLHRLLKTTKQVDSSLIPTILRLSIANIQTSPCVIYRSDLHSDLRKSLSDRHIRRKLGRLQRLKVDQRYARITTIMVTQFIIAWTPYAIIALIIVRGHIDLVRKYPILVTSSELLAKLSLIINPLILISTTRMRPH